MKTANGMHRIVKSGEVRVKAGNGKSIACRSLSVTAAIRQGSGRCSLRKMPGVNAVKRNEKRFLKKYLVTFSLYKYDGKDVKEFLSSEDKADLNKYYFILGFGADIFATDNVFIRVTPMFGFKLNKPHNYQETKDNYSKADTKYSDIGYMFNLGIGAGYKF